VLELRFADQDTDVEKLRGSALAAPGDGRVEILRETGSWSTAEDGEAALAAVHALDEPVCMAAAASIPGAKNAR